jgi:hypothetical protein
VSDLLPVMAPACGWRSPGLGCWARRDSAPPFVAACESYEGPYAYACDGPPAGPLGLCAYHQARVFPQVRSG